MRQFISGIYLKQTLYFRKAIMFNYNKSPSDNTFKRGKFDCTSKSFNQVIDDIKLMTIEEKRKLYRNENFLTVDEIETWSSLANSIDNQSSEWKQDEEECYKFKPELNKKISIYEGNIVCLEIDAIVNAANSSLLGGGGVDAVIHKAAGKYLYDECKTLHGCPTGEAKITFGFNLPASNVLHTVGPIGEKPSQLESCYMKCLELAANNKLRTIAFPCISTGVYGYPNKEAAIVALNTVRTFLESNSDDFDRIIFCLFLDIDKVIYKKLLPRYFPIQ